MTRLRTYSRLPGSLAGATCPPSAQAARPQVLDSLADVAIQVTPTQTLKISDHEEDNRFYECADAAGADYIVTSNTRHFNKPYKTTQIVNARQLLERLAGTHRKE